MQIFSNVKCVTTCEPFKDTLIELNINDNSGVGDYGLKNCNFIKILYAKNKKKLQRVNLLKIL